MSKPRGRSTVSEKLSEIGNEKLVYDGYLCENCGREVQTISRGSDFVYYACVPGCFWTRKIIFKNIPVPKISML